MSIAENITCVQEAVASACARARRDPAEVTLIAVSKTRPLAAIQAAVEAGLQHFGENRVEELQQKVAQFPIPVTWHMIGHIQSRKAKLVPPVAQVLHSLDSVPLAEKLSKAAGELGKVQTVLIEMNVSGEASKGGFLGAEWQQDGAVRAALLAQIAQVIALPHLNVTGLMTMAPIVDEMEQARPVFASLAALRQALQEAFGRPFPDLSMGMTDDYPVAIEEGATMIRIGRAIFGDRP